MTPCIESTRTPSQERPWLWNRGHRIPESHRVWEKAHGPVPEGMWLLHRCDNPRCIRIDHLFLGTNSDNIRDAVAKGRHSETRKTHCPWGHTYDEANTYRTPGDGDRRCKECNRERTRRNYWVKKAVS